MKPKSTDSEADAPTATPSRQCVTCAVDKCVTEINLQMRSGKLSLSFQIKVIKANFLRE